MRLLLVHDNSPEALAAERRLAEGAELKVCHSLEEAVQEATEASWGPELVVVELGRETAPDFMLLGYLREAAGDAPIVLGAGNAWQIVELMSQGRASPPPRFDRRRPNIVGLVESLIEQQRVLGGAIVAHRAELASDIERMATQAADAAATRATTQLAARLGLDDSDGLHVAVRFARGWEEAKHKFIATITTGLASALLLALGAGIVAIVRSSAPK